MNKFDGVYFIFVKYTINYIIEKNLVTLSFPLLRGTERVFALGRCPNTNEIFFLTFLYPSNRNQGGNLRGKRTLSVPLHRGMT